MVEMRGDVWCSKMPKVVDGHVHMGPVSTEERIQAIREVAGIDKISLVSIQDPATGSGLAQSLYMKARYPETFYVFAGLNHAHWLSEGRVETPSLVEQVETFAALGCEGIKMIEGKPTSRQRMDLPVTDAYYADYWAKVEQLGVPIVWHVNDPEEFWDPERLPSWAKERKWGYGPEDVQKEQLYTEVDQVLAQHPRLRIILAHFYFLSADLPRAIRFLEAHPTVSFDVTPGIEMLYNLSRDPQASRAFFCGYADRIVFGTDLSSGLTVEEGRFRAGIIYRWLESEDTFRIPQGSDFLLGAPEDGVVHGLSLPEDVLAEIYGGNFARLAGEAPRALNVPLAIQECARLADIAQAMSDIPAAATEAGKVASLLAEGA